MRAELLPGRRGMSAVFGFVLLFGVVAVAVAVLLLAGGQALEDSTAGVDVSRAGSSLIKLDSEVSSVALGASSSKQVDLGLAASEGTAHVSSESGWMRVTIRNATDGTVDARVANETLGAVTYERDGTTVAYQGGGVWRSDGDASMVVSRPEFHFNGQTLTLPIIAIDHGYSGGLSGLPKTVRASVRFQTRRPASKTGFGGRKSLSPSTASSIRPGHGTSARSRTATC